MTHTNLGHCHHKAGRYVFSSLAPLREECWALEGPLEPQDAGQIWSKSLRTRVNQLTPPPPSSFLFYFCFQPLPWGRLSPLYHNSKLSALAPASLNHKIHNPTLPPPGTALLGEWPQEFHRGHGRKGWRTAGRASLEGPEGRQ